jgi:aconitate hydratase
MNQLHNWLGTLQSFDLGNGESGLFYSLRALEKAGLGRVSRLPVSLRILLESVLRNFDERKVTEQSVRELAGWQPRAERKTEIPFVVSRILLQDFTGVPLLVDLAAMRSAVARLGNDPGLVEPRVPVDLVIDHSLQVDFHGTPEAFQRNLQLEFKRNRERYQFLKWGRGAFRTFRVIQPGTGIIHQINLEYLAQGVCCSSSPAAGGGAEGGSTPRVYCPDTLVGTDSHSTMINGLGIVGWGVGGIEAEAGMLGQPIYLLTPDVVGVRLAGRLQPGVTATDAALTLTQLLRRAQVVGKFVEFFGPGAAALPVVDRATIANMAPEYGATMGFFPIDEECVKYLLLTGRREEHCRLYENYYRAQGLFGMHDKGQVDYSDEIEFALDSVTPSVAGPRRPQDRIELPDLKREFTSALVRPAAKGGFGKTAEQVAAPPAKVSLAGRGAASVGHGSVVIAAITSCTNTSNPNLMLAAGLLARKAVEAGLRTNPVVKASLAPGSRIVGDYLERTGLQASLDALGFNLVGYGCATCIGNSGPLAPELEEVIHGHDVVVASVLSGNRNFEARIHQAVKANFLMSPPLVVAFAIAGRVDIDLASEPLGVGKNGEPVFLADIWPTEAEVRALAGVALSTGIYRSIYGEVAGGNPLWDSIPSAGGHVYDWDPQSTYIQEPPYFAQVEGPAKPMANILGARALAIFGDSITTDHISPAGAIGKSSPAAEYLLAKGVPYEDFNTYGARRGNDRVMTRGTFANVRLKNLMLGGQEGGWTLFFGHKDSAQAEKLTTYDAARRYASEGTPLIVVAGREYGAGSSRDWAAKGPALLGVKAVLTASFERIHRSNLAGMGILPLQFKEGESAESLMLTGPEVYDILGIDANLQPQQELAVRIHRPDRGAAFIQVKCRLDTPIEVEYYQQGGILPFVLRELLSETGVSAR